MLLSPCCLLVAIAFVIAEGGKLDPVTVGFILIGALAAHISVNLLNEYYDYRSGLDLQTQRTPFSGGSGGLLIAPACAETVKHAGLLCLAVTILIGLYFVWNGAWALLPLGVAGVTLVYSYSPYITRLPWLCLLAPGLGFGPLMILGTYILLNGQHPLTILPTSLVVMLVVSNLLLLNQFPDLEPDRDAGRLHFPILIGRRNSARLYVALLIIAYATLSISLCAGLLPPQSLLSLMTLPIAIPTAILALKYPNDMKKLMPALGLNVALTLSLPILIALGLFWNSQI